MIPCVFRCPVLILYFYDGGTIRNPFSRLNNNLVPLTSIRILDLLFFSPPLSYSKPHLFQICLLRIQLSTPFFSILSLCQTVKVKPIYPHLHLHFHFQVVKSSNRQMDGERDRDEDENVTRTTV